MARRIRIVTQVRVLITGATGYIGSAVVEALQRAGHDVVGLARSEQAAEALKRAGCEPHRGDITDPAGLTAALAGADAVVHTAVGTGGGFVGDADHAVVDAMLAALAERQGTLVLTSGLGVYAGYRVPFIDEDTPLDDVIPPQRPRVALEERALSVTDRGVRAVVLRPGNVYGGGSAGIFTRMLLDATLQAGRGVMVGEGAGLYGGVHRDDLAAAYVIALETPSVGGRLHLVSQTATMRDVAAAMSHGIGAGGETMTITLEEAQQRWGPLGLGFLGGPIVSSVRATAELGWRPAGPSLPYELIHGSLRLSPSD